MYILGTAGHVDHGKSALVRALTGIDPDRLTEEKERGMTIDLGFAWLGLPSGREVSIVDVPGHERFIKNMLAGVGGIDLAMLVIAADEGVMPQTREHLAILDLLNVRKGIIVITKKDLVDAELLELVSMDAEDVICGTTLDGAPLVSTSAMTGEGLPDLLAAIDTLLDSVRPRRDIGRPRLSIDRVFTMRGFGTVVTGTLNDGTLSVGQEIVLLPSGQRTHIRGLQTHKRKVDSVPPGSRVAVNLSGISTEDVQRGYVLTKPGWLTPTRFVDVRLRAISDLPQAISHNKSITFHTGASEVMGKVRLLDRETLNSGESGWAQILLAQHVAVARGDPFIVRSPQGTLGGGTIFDAHAKRHRRFQPGVIASLEARVNGSPKDILLAIVEANEPIEFEAVVAQSSLSHDEASIALKTLAAEKQVVTLGSEGARTILLSASGWNHLEEESRRIINSYHAQFPLRLGMPKEELRSRLKILSQHLTSVLQQLIGTGTVVEEGALIRLPTHAITPSADQQAEIQGFLHSLTANPFSPSWESLPSPDVLNLLIDQRRVVKVSENVLFDASAYDEMVKRIIEHLKAQGKITVAEVRDMFQTSRKYALALMEHLDEQKTTKRIGDERVLR